MDGDGTLDYEDVAEGRIREIWSALVKAAENALNNSDTYRNYLYSALGEVFEISVSDLSEMFVIEDGDEITDFTNELLESILNLGKSGVELDDILNALSSSSSLEEFQSALSGIAEKAEEVSSS